MDAPRFRYTLEVLRRKREHELARAERRLGALRVQQEALREAIAERREAHRRAAEASGVSAGRAFDPGIQSARLRFIARLGDEIARLEGESTSLAEQLRAAQLAHVAAHTKLDAVEEDRATALQAHGLHHARLASSEFDREWLARMERAAVVTEHGEGETWKP